MIAIAASDLGDYLVLVIMLVFGLINWVANKLKAGKAPPQPQKRDSRPAARPVASAPPTRNAEEERMRRFLEALGVPQDETPPPAPPPRPAPKPVAAPPAPVVTRSAPPPPLPQKAPSIDERSPLPDLRPAPVREFETISSRVSADQDGEFVTVASTISATPSVARQPERETPSSQPPTHADSRALLAKLRSSADIRTALILSEILGPPRGLRRPRN